MLKNFWKLESLGIKSKTSSQLSKEDQKAHEMMTATITLIDGHYEVGLPWRSDQGELLNNQNMALRRFYNLENRLKKDPETSSRYITLIEDLIRAGQAVKVVSTDMSDHGRSWYLPHRNVKNKNKPDKTRVVYDASATHQGSSLNTALLRGTGFLPNLPGLLMRFREHPIAVSADIEKIFYQVRVPDRDQSALRFYWRRLTTKSIDVQNDCKMFWHHLVSKP